MQSIYLNLTSRTIAIGFLTFTLMTAKAFASSPVFEIEDQAVTPQKNLTYMSSTLPGFIITSSGEDYLARAGVFLQMDFKDFLVQVGINANYGYNRSGSISEDHEISIAAGIPVFRKNGELIGVMIEVAGVSLSRQNDLGGIDSIGIGGKVFFVALNEKGTVLTQSYLSIRQLTAAEVTQIKMELQGILFDRPFGLDQTAIEFHSEGQLMVGSGTAELHPAVRERFITSLLIVLGYESKSGYSLKLGPAAGILNGKYFFGLNAKYSLN